MATKVQKLTLSFSRDIPFNKLVLSQANVRRVKAGLSIEELAEDIARRSLLQGLTVRPVLDAEGAETGMYEVPAGGRRFRALELLVRQKRLARTAPVPCVVRDPATSILAEDDSLAENVQRAPLHPLDQFRAFQAMRAKGMAEEEIAAAFFVAPTVVRQRLRLAAVSARLLDLYAEDGLTLEQLMAFTVSNDPARQEQVWEALASSWSKEPYQIRRLLTERTVRASDRRARFVGTEAYERAGGIVLRDLFQGDDGGWLQDAGLLDRLVAEKLKGAAEALAAEGWKWVEAAVDLPYDHARGLRALPGTRPALTGEEQAAVEALDAEYAQLAAGYEDADELPEAVEARLGEIETALAALSDRPALYDPGEIARAGAFVTIGADGELVVERGYVRPEDEAPTENPGQEEHVAGLGKDQDGATASMPGVQRAVITIGGVTSETDEEDDGTLKPLPERLVMELTAHRTLALRNAVANDPQVALTALLHKLVTDAFQRGASTGGCLDVGVRHILFPMQVVDLKASPSAASITARHEGWRADLPRDEDALWDWLHALDEASRLALLAHCVSFGVNALVEKVDRHGGPGLSQRGLDARLAQAGRLARAVGLDMVEAGWAPTADNYLGRVPKARILAAVREAKGERAVDLIDHLKKADMAREAERLLADTGWLPEPLRSTDAAAAEAEGRPSPQSGDAALPDFLTADDADGVGHAIAAE